MNVEQYAKDRDAAIIDAVMNDKWDKARQFCKKYDSEIPANETVFKLPDFLVNVKNSKPTT